MNKQTVVELYRWILHNNREVTQGTLYNDVPCVTSELHNDFIKT